MDATTMTATITAIAPADVRRTEGPEMPSPDAALDRLQGALAQPVDVCEETARGVSALAILWRRFVLFLGGAALIFGSVELGLAVTKKSTPQPIEFGRRKPMPYLEFYSEPNFHGGGIETNDAGFRYGPLPLAKPPGEIRIFFLSNSVGFRGTTNDTTIPGLMERQLASLPQTRGRRIRVINASGTSFCSRQSLVLLVTRVLAYEPDILVVFHGPEALHYPTIYESRPGYPFNFKVRERLQDKFRERIQGPGTAITLLMKTRLMQHFHPNLSRNAQQQKLAEHNNVITINSLERYDPYIDSVADDAQKIARIAWAYKCRTVVAIPPWDSSALLPGAVDRLADSVRRSVADCDAESVHFLDTNHLVEEMNARQLWKPDGVHWNDNGNQLVAEYLVNELAGTGFLD